jgi:hypothetical protein
MFRYCQFTQEWLLKNARTVKGLVQDGSFCRKMTAKNDQPLFFAGLDEYNRMNQPWPPF